MDSTLLEFFDCATGAGHDRSFIVSAFKPSMRELRSTFAIAQRQTLAKEARAERLGPTLTSDQVRKQ